MTYFSLRNIAAVCGAIFVLALAYLILAEGHAAGAVFGAFSEQSFPAKLAWLIVVVVPLVLIPAAVWLGETLVRQRQAALALELRLDGVRQNVKGLVKSQVEAEMAVHQLVRTDPEDAVNALQQRLAEAGALLQTQQSRNEIGDLDSHVEAVRSRQQALQQRLGPIVEKRRSIEQLFVDLDTRQHDIERALAEVAGGGDAVALDIGLKKMTDFVRQSHDRCDEIERASQVIAGLQQDFTGLQTRLTPLADSAEGVMRRVKDLSVARDQLADEIASLEQTAQGPLAARVQKFADDRKLLEDRLSQLTTQFARLATLRKEIEGLFANFDRALTRSAKPPKRRARSTSTPASRNWPRILNRPRPISTRSRGVRRRSHRSETGSANCRRGSIRWKRPTAVSLASSANFARSATGCSPGSNRSKRMKTAVLASA